MGAAEGLVGDLASEGATWPSVGTIYKLDAGGGARRRAGGGRYRPGRRPWSPEVMVGEGACEQNCPGRRVERSAVPGPMRRRDGGGGRRGTKAAGRAAAEA